MLFRKLTLLTDTQRRLVSIFIPAGISWLLTAISVLGFEEYGWAVFIFVPLFIGAGSAILYGYQRRITTKVIFGVSSLALVTYCAGLVLFAIEGLICIIMAAPLGIAVTYLGTLIGITLLKTWDKMPLTVLAGLGLMIPFLMGFESAWHEKADLFSVRTSVIINKSPEEVWPHIIEFSRIKPPDELIFKAGIAYPTHAVIKGTGKGAIRYCNFSTGCFVEPVTNWQPPGLLQFSVEVTPRPMTELSPYHIEPAHLHGYFVSEKGQFRLIQMSGNKTKLEGTTWYYHRIKPAFYWKVWSNYIIHKIHNRVLQHIKAESENN